MIDNSERTVPPTSNEQARPMSDSRQQRLVFAEHLQSAIAALDLRNAFRGPMAPDRAILTSLFEYLEGSSDETFSKSPGDCLHMDARIKCPTCGIDFPVAAVDPIHLSKGGRDPDAKIYSARMVEALVGIALACNRTPPSSPETSAQPATGEQT